MIDFKLAAKRIVDAIPPDCAEDYEAEAVRIIASALTHVAEEKQDCISELEKEVAALKSEEPGHPLAMVRGVFNEAIRLGLFSHHRSDCPLTALVREIERLRGEVQLHENIFEEAAAVMHDADAVREENTRLKVEIARLKRGDFTPEEFQNLCHHRDESPGCTRADFEAGCREYQQKLFGPLKMDAFHKAVAEEREACALVAEDAVESGDNPHDRDRILGIAAKIRARGNV